MACFLLFTRPPLPPLPERSVPLFLRVIALLTDFPAAFPYLAITPPLLWLLLRLRHLEPCLAACANPGTNDFARDYDFNSTIHLSPLVGIVARDRIRFSESHSGY
jgi:hypothetical protein